MTTDVESSGCGSMNRNHWQNLPIREMTLSLIVVAPCLAHIFTIPFMLCRSGGIIASYYDPDPLTVGFDNDTSTNTTANIMYEERDIFSTWPMESLVAKLQKARECKLMFFISMGFGSIIAGVASGFLGRKAICNTLIALTIVAGFLVTQAPTLGVFEILWCLIALCTFGTYTATYLSVAEMLPDKVRTPIHLFVFGLSWTVGRAVGLSVAWFTRDWILIMYCLSTCILITHLLTFMISWKFKISDGKRHTEDKIWQLFTHKRYLRRLIILFLNWFLLGYISYTINLSATRIVSDNIFVEMSFKGVMEFISMSLTVAITYKYKCTLRVYSSLMFLSGVCYLIMSPFETNHNIRGAMVHLINFIGGGSFGLLWITTVYSFPKRFRGTAMGLCSLSARLGAASGVNILETIGSAKPVALSITLGILVIVITALFFLILPERSQLPLLETIQSEDDEIKAKQDGAAEAKRADLQDAANQTYSAGNSNLAPHETTPRPSLLTRFSNAGFWRSKN